MVHVTRLNPAHIAQSLIRGIIFVLQREQHHREAAELDIHVFAIRRIVGGVAEEEFVAPKANVIAHARGEYGKFSRHCGFYLQAGFPPQPERSV